MRPHAGAALLAIGALTACLELKEDEEARLAVARRDSIAAAEALARRTARTTAVIPPARKATSAVDTLNALGETPVSVAPSPAVPIAASTAGPGASPRPSSAEIAALDKALRMPVQGADPAKLIPSFDDARGSRRHDALDIHAPRGTPVLSATDGTLRHLHESKAGGLMIYASDATGRFVLMYAHLDRYADGLREGMPLSAGQVIGYVGTTGNAPPTVPHLHFAIARVAPDSRWWRGTPVDPYPLLSR